MLTPQETAQSFFTCLGGNDRKIPGLFADNVHLSLPAGHHGIQSQDIDASNALDVLAAHLWPIRRPSESRTIGLRTTTSGNQIALLGQISEKTTSSSRRKVRELALHLVLDDNGKITLVHLYEDVLTAAVAFDLFDPEEVAAAAA